MCLIIMVLSGLGVRLYSTHMQWECVSIHIYAFIIYVYTYYMHICVCIYNVMYILKYIYVIETENMNPISA